MIDQNENSLFFYGSYAILRKKIPPEAITPKSVLSGGYLFFPKDTLIKSVLP